MGIQGLLPVLKSITRPLHVSAFRGNRVAVDAYCWLHRGAYTCSREICEGIPTDKCAAPSRVPVCCDMLRHGIKRLQHFKCIAVCRYVTFCMARVELLRSCGVEPVLVFDGANLPMKADEEGTRRRCADSVSRVRTDRPGSA